MFRWVCKASRFEFEGREYKRGDVISTDTNLGQIFRNLFRPAEDQVVEAPRRPRQEVSVLPPPPPEPATDKGRDVTKNFPSAAGEDYKVFKKGVLYFVHDQDEEQPLNAEGLSKGKVEVFIKELLEK